MTIEITQIIVRPTTKRYIRDNMSGIVGEQIMLDMPGTLDFEYDRFTEVDAPEDLPAETNEQE